MKTKDSKKWEGMGLQEEDHWVGDTVLSLSQPHPFPLTCLSLWGRNTEESVLVPGAPLQDTDGKCVGVNGKERRKGEKLCNKKEIFLLDCHQLPASHARVSHPCPHCPD